MIYNMVHSLGTKRTAPAGIGLGAVGSAGTGVAPRTRVVKDATPSRRLFRHALRRRRLAASCQAFGVGRRARSP